MNAIALQCKSVCSIFLFNYDCSPAAIVFCFCHGNTVRFDALQFMLRGLRRNRGKKRIIGFWFSVYEPFEFSWSGFTCDVESGSSILSWLRARPMPPSAIFTQWNAAKLMNGQRRNYSTIQQQNSSHHLRQYRTTKTKRLPICRTKINLFIKINNIDVTSRSLLSFSRPIVYAAPLFTRTRHTKRLHS